MTRAIHMEAMAMTQSMTTRVTIAHGVAETFVDVLEARALATPDQLAFAFLGDGEQITEQLSYGELRARARAIAVELARELSPGDRAVLLYPSGIEFIAAFLGCLYAGVVAVPILPPVAARMRQAVPALLEILRAASPQAILTSSSTGYLHQMSQLAEGVARLRWIETDKVETRRSSLWRRPDGLGASSLAFLQFTSGSTGAPKGVIVTQGNLVANAEMISRTFALCERDVVCHWLPLYHDMGLIGCTLAPIWAGSPVYFMSPMEFLLRPVRWLQAFTRFGGTVGAAPNFGYELCIRRCTEAERAALDLSTWTRALNGSEPIVESTLTRFAGAFAGAGFRLGTFRPCYGLAEATLLVSGTVIDPEPFGISIARDALTQGQIAPLPAGAPGSVRLMASGTVVAPNQVEIVDPVTRTRAAPHTVGEIWVRGPSVAVGYWRNDEATTATFEATLGDGGERFMRTGDLGFVSGAHLVVTGRLKDVIIHRGANYYPQDIERTVAQIASVKPGGAAAFSMRAHDATEDRVVLVIECRRGAFASGTAAGELAPNPPGPAPTIEAFVEHVRHEVSDAHGLGLFDVCVVPNGSIPRTSSGKIQRGAVRKLYAAQRLTRLTAADDAARGEPAA